MAISAKTEPGRVRRAALPGPKGGLVLGSLPDLTADWLGYLIECERKYGRLVHFRLPWPLKSIVLVTDPEHIERIFINDAAMFRKPVTQRVGKPVLGDGLFLTEGEVWKRLHRMSVPAFQPARIKTYADDMAACAEQMVAEWEHGAERDIFGDTTHLTVQIVARTLFGTDAGPDAERASHGLAGAFSAFDSYFNSRFPLPLSLPTPAGIRIYKARSSIRLSTGSSASAATPASNALTCCRCCYVPATRRTARSSPSENCATSRSIPSGPASRPPR